MERALLLTIEKGYQAMGTEDIEFLVKIEGIGDPIIVSEAVWMGLEAVRLSGKTNMLDVPEVQRLAFEMEHFATVLWIEENFRQYKLGVFAGFEIEDDSHARNAQ